MDHEGNLRRFAKHAVDLDLLRESQVAGQFDLSL
jgi:hypothetical protein